MYTKNQFNKLLKTRKYWTGKQLGRMLVQTTLEQMNGKTPFIDPDKDLGPLVDTLVNPKDLRDYDTYVNLCSGIASAWNFTEATGRDAIANLMFIRSIVRHLLDWTNAEINNQERPAMITQKQYDEYKKQAQASVAKAYEKAENCKETLSSLITELPMNYDVSRDSVRKFWPHATNVINSYKNKHFTAKDIQLLRDMLQKEHFAYKPNLSAYDELDTTSINNGFDDIEFFLNLPNKFPLNDNTRIFLQRHYSTKPSEDIDSIVRHYLKLINDELFKLLHRRRLSYWDARLEAIKKYPYSVKVVQAFNSVSIKTKQVPYIPDKLTYADLFWTSEATTYIANSFWSISVNFPMRHPTDDIGSTFTSFVDSHFSDFVEASKKDLIEKYPKLDKILNEVTNSTSLIIPQITWKSLASAGIEVFKELIEDVAQDNIQGITDVFPERIRESAKENGFAVLAPESRIGVDKSSPLYESDEEVVDRNQHYDLKNFVSDTLNDNEIQKQISKATKAIEYYIIGQTAYTDFIKGVARYADNRSLRNYSQTDAFPELVTDVQQYENEFLHLIRKLSIALYDNKESQLSVNAEIRKAMPAIHLKSRKFKHKTIPELVELIKGNYENRRAPESVFDIINTIAKGASNYA